MNDFPGRETDYVKAMQRYHVGYLRKNKEQKNLHLVYMQKFFFFFLIVWSAGFFVFLSFVYLLVGWLVSFFALVF